MSTEQHDPGGRLLDQLFAAAAPYVDAAARSQAAAPAMTICRVYASPLRVEVAHHQRSGQVREFRAAGDPALAEITASFLTGGIRTLSERQRRAALDAVDRGRAQWIVLLDIEAGTAGGALVPANEGADPVLVFVLHRPASVH